MQVFANTVNVVTTSYRSTQKVPFLKKTGMPMFQVYQEKKEDIDYKENFVFDEILHFVSFPKTKKGTMFAFRGQLTGWIYYMTPENMQPCVKYLTEGKLIGKFTFDLDGNKKNTYTIKRIADMR